MIQHSSRQYLVTLAPLPAYTANYEGASRVAFTCAEGFGDEVASLEVGQSAIDAGTETCILRTA